MPRGNVLLHQLHNFFCNRIEPLDDRHRQVIVFRQFSKGVQRMAIVRRLQGVGNTAAAFKTRSAPVLRRGCAGTWTWCHTAWRRARTVGRNSVLPFLRRYPLGVTVAGSVLVLLFILWKVPQWQVADPSLSAKDRIELENKARATLAQIVGGMFILVGLYLTLRRVQTADRAVQVAEEGQVTERFTRAIDQLGSDSLQIRLGGIYALERIARDSAKDHWPIMEVLTAYVRERAAWKGFPIPQDTDTPAPATDIQAILTVLGRRIRCHENQEQRLDLRKTDLRKAYLQATHLEGADLSGANLAKANLTSAHLEGARLWEAYLERAFLGDAHLERGSLLEANLDRALLSGAYLEDADLSGAHLQEARLSAAHLERVDFRDAHLEGARLGLACAEGANFQAAYLERAYFVGTHLEGADLQAAHLEGADLTNAVSLTREQIAQATIDECTRLPDYLRREDPGT